MGLYKRRKVWWMSCTYRGRQCRQSTGTSDRRLAEAVLAKVKVRIVEGRFFDTLQERERTFGELMERFLAEHVVKKASQRSYRGCVKNLCAFFGPYTLAEISPKLIVEYKHRRYADGRTPATINRELAAMKKAFNLAIREWEWCRENPVSRVAMEKEQNTRDRWLTREEQRRLLQSCSPWLRELVVFALSTGMRMGEILALSWSGVDLFRRTVTVMRSKNGERRTIPLNQTTLELLKKKTKVRPFKTDLVFCSQVQTPLESGHLRRAFRAAVKQAKIEDFHFHDLRHTFATQLVQGGIDLYKVQRLLGHKSPLMTQRYAHHWPESLREGVEILDREENVITNLSQSGCDPTQLTV